MSIKTNPFLLGVSSGYPEIDKLTKGWMKTDLIMIDSSDKTEVKKMIISLLKSTIKENLHSVFFTLNDTSKILSKQFPEFLDRFECICVSDKLETNLHEIRMICRQLKRRKNTEIIVFESLEILISLSNNIANCSKDNLKTLVLKELKELALEINVPLIIYSNLMGDTSPIILKTMYCHKSVDNSVDIFGILSGLKNNVFPFVNRANDGDVSSQLTIIKNNTGLIREAYY